MPHTAGLVEGESDTCTGVVQQFEKLSNDLANLEIIEAEELRGIVNIIFDKALEEGHFCKMYAQLCRVIQERMPEFEDPSGESKREREREEREGDGGGC